MVLLNKLLNSYRLFLVIVITIFCFSNLSQAQKSSVSAIAKPLLYKKIPVPEELRARQGGLSFGGDIRTGDLTGNGQADLLVYRGAGGDRQGATKPCFIGAFTMDGKVLWQTGSGGVQPYRPGPAAIHDIDNDGQSEVVCFFIKALKIRIRLA